MNEHSLPILFVDHAPALGGAEHSLLLILKHLNRQRWQAHLACCGGPLAERAANSNIPVHATPMPRLRRSPHAPLDLWRGVQSLASTVRHSGARLVIANTVRAAFYAAPAARLSGRPFIWYRRDFWLGEMEPRRPWTDQLIKRLMCATACCVIANSQATASKHPCPHKIYVVPNGIDISRFDPDLDGQPFRQEHKLPAGVPIVGSLGRLCPIKGQDSFLRILSQVRQRSPDVLGLIVGGEVFGQTGYTQTLQQLASELGLTQHVVFTGQLDDPRPALAAMDIFVQSGQPEAFGLVNVEAMASGLPVVAFGHGALPDIVADGQTGLLVPSQDEAGLAAAIVRLVQDPARRIAMGQAGRLRVIQNFTIEQTVHRLETILTSTLNP